MRDRDKHDSTTELVDRCLKSFYELLSSIIASWSATGCENVDGRRKALVWLDPPQL